MGSVSSAISKAALEAGVQIVTNAEVPFRFLWHDTSCIIYKAGLWTVICVNLNRKLTDQLFKTVNWIFPKKKGHL
jgi:hypothetical protein